MKNFLGKFRLETFFGRTELILITTSIQAGHLHQVEVNGAHQLRGGRVGHLQAREQHIIANAVRSVK